MILEILDVLYLLMNIFALIMIAGCCVCESIHDNKNLLFYPYIINMLNDKLNKAGIIIVLIIISIILGPAIIMYFIISAVMQLAVILWRGFCRLFRKR